MVRGRGQEARGRDIRRQGAGGRGHNEGAGGRVQTAGG